MGNITRAKWLCYINNLTRLTLCYSSCVNKQRKMIGICDPKIICGSLNDYSVGATWLQNSYNKDYCWNNKPHKVKQISRKETTLLELPYLLDFFFWNVCRAIQSVVESKIFPGEEGALTLPEAPNFLNKFQKNTFGNLAHGVGARYLQPRSATDNCTRKEEFCSTVHG